MVLEAICVDGLWQWPDNPEFCPMWSNCTFTEPNKYIYIYIAVSTPLHRPTSWCVWALARGPACPAASLCFSIVD